MLLLVLRLSFFGSASVGANPFWIEDLSLVVGDVCALFHADSERFLVCFQDLHLEVFFYLLCPMFNISGGAAFEKISFQAFLCQPQGGARSNG